MNIAKRARWLLLLSGVLVCAMGAVCEAQTEAAPAPGSKAVYLPDGHPPLPIGYRNERDVMLKVFESLPGVDKEEVLQFIRVVFPAEMLRFQGLALSGSDVAADFLSSLVRQALELLDMKRHDPERFQTVLQQRIREREATDMVEAIRTSEGEARERMLKELERALGDVFEMKQKMMQADLAKMKKDLDELTALIEKRQQSREAIIKRRIEVLTGELDHMEW